ncbi:hypothetical protein M595_4346 [Lyngbya aestuarii BL J]|uniref:Uncharacterized protein n=1 Tax=Lyngbya aestuarii BL J TaxID=1348334 RepID=U7QCT7_9CYAN|nr:hypothetical protein M595_4346 [Lyngbya aestuarii BL J]
MNGTLDEIADQEDRLTTEIKVKIFPTLFLNTDYSNRRKFKREYRRIPQVMRESLN